jgi:RimJ/RimL family protein N-acetyltransferase
MLQQSAHFDLNCNPVNTMKVTRPIFPTPAKAFTTARLLLRPITVDDLAEFRILRTQPEVMIHTARGTVDEDQAATRAWMDRYLHPNDSKTFIFAVEELSTPGVIVGSLGSHVAEPPTLGYMLRKEFWSYGYATEAVQGWLKEYWKLPRREIDMQDTMLENSQLHWHGDMVREALFANIESGNTGSIKVIQKCGFNPTEFEEKEEDFRGPAVLVHYYLERSGS